MRYVPKGTNQKLKLYYLAKIMVNNTDDEHAMTLQDIKMHWSSMRLPQTGKVCMMILMCYAIWG